ncbi:MAG: NUDIX hydrolase [Pyrinomonadaceae bacterium MAG19_C2-C3]|nr:NUDIX hydrolase [Pyrinomonadaceae bacterium MAG19_C2-C3]
MNTPDKPIPEIVESKIVFRGKVFNVTADRVREEGKEYVRDIVRHPGSACIIAVDDERHVSMVKQYRHPARDFLIEIPAGSRHDEGEPAETCARRELEEELGIVAESLELLIEFYVSPGYFTEKMWIYLATGLRATQQNLDEDENIEIIKLPLDEALKMIETGEIIDAKTIIGIPLAAQRLKEIYSRK